MFISCTGGKPGGEFCKKQDVNQLRQERERWGELLYLWSFVVTLSVSPTKKKKKNPKNLCPFWLFVSSIIQKRFVRRHVVFQAWILVFTTAPLPWSASVLISAKSYRTISSTNPTVAEWYTTWSLRLFTSVSMSFINVCFSQYTW